MKASEARKISENTTTTVFTNKIKDIYANIENNAKLHHTRMSYGVENVNEMVIKLLIKQLESDGYTVEHEVKTGVGLRDDYSYNRLSIKW